VCFRVCYVESKVGKQRRENTAKSLGFAFHVIGVDGELCPQKNRALCKNAVLVFAMLEDP